MHHVKLLIYTNMKKLLKKIAFFAFVGLIALGAYYGNEYERYALFFVACMGIPMAADGAFSD